MKTYYSLVAQRVQSLPAMWETWVRSLGWEDPLEKEMATHSSTLAWKIPWTEEPGGLQSMGSQRVGHDWATSLSFSLSLFTPGLPRYCSGKGSPARAGGTRDLGTIPGSGRSPGEGNGNPFQFSCLGHPMNGGAWWATICGVPKSGTRLSIHTHYALSAKKSIIAPFLLHYSLSFAF